MRGSGSHKSAAARHPPAEAAASNLTATARDDSTRWCPNRAVHTLTQPAGDGAWLMNGPDGFTHAADRLAPPTQTGNSSWVPSGELGV